MFKYLKTKNTIMRTRFIFVIISLSVTMFSCNNGNSLSSKRPLYPKTGNYFKTAKPHESLIIADPIIYDVVVKNPDTADVWTTFCLKNTDIDAISKAILNAVYQKRLTPYYYRSDDSILPIDSIKSMEQRFGTKDIGKMQFNEKWFFNEDSLKLYKEVVSITFGYELKNDLGEVYGYRPAFKVYLNGNKKQLSK